MMGDGFHDPRKRRDAATLRGISIAIALSLLLHLALFLQWKLQPPTPDDPIHTLTVQLQPLPGRPAAPPSRPSKAAPPPHPAADIPPPQAAVQPALPRNDVPLAIERDSTAIAPPPPTEPAVAARPPVPSEIDFAAHIEAQRRARGERVADALPLEDENARATRLAVANLAQKKAQGFGYDPGRSGGVFQIKRVGVDYAEFMFYGWHREIRRDMAQLIEVRKGTHSDIQIAVVRRMIEIIRDYEQADFVWRSHRLNRSLTLSARQRDSAGLEEFLMREFFYNPRVAP